MSAAVEEGRSHRYRGSVPVLLTVLPALTVNCATGIFVFSVYEWLDAKGVHPACAGAIAGAAVSPLVVPIDALKLRLAAHRAQATRAHATGGVYRTTQLQAVLATRLSDLQPVAKAAVVGREVFGLGSFFWVHSELKRVLVHRHVDLSTDSKTHLHVVPTMLAATGAAAATMAVTAPFDAIRRHQGYTQHGGTLFPELTFWARWRFLLLGSKPLLWRIVPPVAGLLAFDFARSQEVAAKGPAPPADSELYA